MLSSPRPWTVASMPLLKIRPKHLRLRAPPALARQSLPSSTPQRAFLRLSEFAPLKGRLRRRAKFSRLAEQNDFEATPW